VFRRTQPFFYSGFSPILSPFSDFGQPVNYSGSCFCISSIISDFTGIASTDPNLVRASEIVAANFVGYSLFEKALKWAI
jgi:hypothetical protein